MCEDPIYIEAREVSTEKDWIGSGSLIIHQVKNTEDWAFGFSKDFGLVGKIKIVFICCDSQTKNFTKLKIILRLVCVKHLNNNQTCTDFEARFCCPKFQPRRVSF